MAISVNSGLHENFDIMYHQKYGYYRDYSKYLKKNKNRNFEVTKKTMSQNVRKISNAMVNTDEIIKADDVITQEICYKPIYYQKIIYSNSMKFGVMY